MYPKNRRFYKCSDVVQDETFNPYCSDVRIAREMSYYVKGGIDLDGVSDRPPLPAAFDDAESVSDGVVNMATDPRVSKLDIMDYASTAMSDIRAKRSAEVLTGDKLE